MIDFEEQMSLTQIGVVHSPILERREMPSHGVRAQVEIFPAYRDGLLLIEGNTHLWIFGWFAGAERDQLQIVRPEYEHGERRRGVFGLRSTTRPNSIGMCVSELVEITNGRLTLDYLDLLDGTPVIDIKRYSPSWDSVFSARSSRELKLQPDEAADLEQLEMDGTTFHGTSSPGIVAGARLMQFVIQRWQVLPHDGRLTLSIPASGQPGDLIDALQGITAATFGSGRLEIQMGDSFGFSFEGNTLEVRPLPFLDRSEADIRAAAIESLFEITME